MRTATRACLVLVGLAGGTASAQSFNLTTDFSETANPNWVWSFTRGGVPLQKFVHAPGHPLNPAATNGMWSTSNTSQYESSVLKMTANGPAGGHALTDFLAGDICSHGTNPGGPDTEIRWGGNVAGTVLATGKVWYAHSQVNRIGLYEFRAGNTLLASGNVAVANNRPNPINFSTGGALTLAPGEALRLSIKPAPGQSAACFFGVDLSVTFIPRSCPADLTFGAIAGQLGYGLRNGIVDNEDFFYYLAQFSAGNLAVADLTTGAIPGQPGYGTPNGVLNNDDFFYYLAIFAAGC